MKPRCDGIQSGAFCFFQQPHVAGLLFVLPFFPIIIMISQRWLLDSRWRGCTRLPGTLQQSRMSASPLGSTKVQWDDASARELIRLRGAAACTSALIHCCPHKTRVQASLTGDAETPIPVLHSYILLQLEAHWSLKKILVTFFFCCYCSFIYKVLV